MRRNSRVAFLCLVVVACSSFLASVTTMAAGQEITHFMYASHGEAWKEYLHTMAERFAKQTGTQVTVIMSDGDYRSKLLAMIAGGTPPDVTDAHPVLGAPFIRDHLFEDLLPYVKRDRVPIDRMPPVGVQGTTAPGGYMWGIPVSIMPVITVFNVDLFAQRGLSNPRQLGENWTWETLRSSARSLTRDTNGDGVADNFGTSRIHYRWEAQVHQAGGMLYDRLVDPSKSRWNSPEVLAGFEFLNTLMNIDRVVSPDYRQNDMPQETVGFTVVDGPGTPFLSSSWDVAVPPKGPGSRSSRVNPDGFQIVAASQNKEAAWQWVKFLVGTADNQLEMSRITRRMPSLKEAMLRYPKVVADLPDNWMAYIDTAFNPDGYAGYVLYNASSIDPIVNGAVGKIWNGQQAPATVLQQIHDQVSAVMAGK
ncbi:MAG: extracellular solute-binding protein [Limnochordia bacterium]|jgi:ABC-type glycerol-3-phosphate transport system substrate-binding protein